MYLYSLLVAMVVVLAIFLTPKRSKVWVATGAISLASLAAIAVAIMAFCGKVVKVVEFKTMFFGIEHLAVDKLSALMLIIISVASVATVLYSRGYVKGYLERFTDAHISMHYTALVTLVVSMIGTGVLGCPKKINENRNENGGRFVNRPYKNDENTSRCGVAVCSLRTRAFPRGEGAELM